MKKKKLLLLALALALVPTAGSAQDLPELLTDVYQSIGDGLAQGAAWAEENQELTLTLETDDARIEAGKPVRLTVTAGNPLPYETAVTLTLSLPDRLAASAETTWEAVLPAAQTDAQTGALTPSVTTFTRELTLLPDGGSETVEIGCELSMGTRFYRAAAPLALCVADIGVSAAVDGVTDGRVQPGDAFAYRIEVTNAGTAAKDVALELTLPQDVALAEPLEAGFVQTGQVIRGQVHAQAATDGAPGSAVITLPVRVDGDALRDDADARRLMAATLRADGERVPMPRMEVCDAKVSARLTAETDSLAVGEETTLRVVVVNAGLAAADVHLSCVLPEGLSLPGKKHAAATSAEAALTDGGDGDLPMTGAAVPGEPAAAPAMTQQDRTLLFDLHMDAAEEGESGVIARTQVIEIPVVADAPQDKLSERLVGASLLWHVDGGEAELGDAVAMRVYRAEFLGMSRADWTGVFWASALLLITVLCLYAAVRKDSKDTDFCCE